MTRDLGSTGMVIFILFKNIDANNYNVLYPKGFEH